MLAKVRRMGSGGSSARARILDSAYELFSTHGVKGAIAHAEEGDVAAA